MRKYKKYMAGLLAGAMIFGAGCSSDKNKPERYGYLTTFEKIEKGINVDKLEALVSNRSKKFVIEFARRGNIDKDKREEIVTLSYATDMLGYVHVLDDTDYGYDVMTPINTPIEGHYISWEDLKLEDINNDNIKEILCTFSIPIKGVEFHPEISSNWRRKVSGESIFLDIYKLSDRSFHLKGRYCIDNKFLDHTPVGGCLIKSLHIIITWPLLLDVGKIFVNPEYNIPEKRQKLKSWKRLWEQLHPKEPFSSVLRDLQFLDKHYQRVSFSEVMKMGGVDYSKLRKQDADSIINKSLSVFQNLSRDILYATDEVDYIINKKVKKIYLH